MLLTKKDIERMTRLLLWVNERVLRTWVADLIHTLNDAESQLTTARDVIAQLERDVAGWRGVAERFAVKPLPVASCVCGGIGCLGCCGQS
jgi:hypothetical protein